MTPRRPHRATIFGFSLIELLVSMVIALVVTLAITSVLLRTEGTKRSTTSVNELNQTASVAAFVLDRAIRNAGSGFSQSWGTTYGCLLDVSQGSTHVLPVTIPSTSTFANVTQPIRLAPVIINKGLADTGAQVRGDILVVMAGTAGISESPTPVGSLSGTSLVLPNKLGYRVGDLILLASQSVGAGCMMQQIDNTAPATGSVSLGGTYYSSAGTNVSLASFGADTVALQIGSVSNMPQLQLYGVGNDNTLFSYDLMQPAATDAAIADGVVEMRALYGVDTTNPPDGVLDSWVDPVPLSGYEASVLTNGGATSQAKLRRIVAVRFGLILRTSLEERPLSTSNPDPSLSYQRASSAVTLFNDLGGTLAYTRTLTGSELNYRFRTVEVTIPLRNVLLAPQS